MKAICMSCRYFRIEDPLSGYCRIKTRESNDGKAPGQMVRHDESCDQWADCGQQYYIRLGWIRAFNARKAENSAH